MMKTAWEWALWVNDGLLYALDTYPRVVAVLWPASLALIAFLMWG